MQPKFSIITVSFNSEKTIEDTIKSIVNQSYQTIEYIIIDGLSKDGTLKIIDKYKDKITVVISEKDNGIFDAFNKGLKLATGDVVGFLNSDDFYVDNTVIAQVARIFQEKNVDGVYGDLVYVNPKDTSKIIRHWESLNFDRKLFERGWMPPHPTLFVRKELYSKYGYFNTWMKISNDYEIVLRLFYKNNATAAYLPKILIKMRAGGNSNGTLKKRYLANKEDREAWKVNGLKMPVLFAILKPLRKITQYFVPQKVKQELKNSW
jgi:glycosyltransferase involved in cell wall biosynthesis